MVYSSLLQIPYLCSRLLGIFGLLWEDCPVHFKILGASLASTHKMPTASLLASLICDKHKFLQTLPRVPFRAEFPLIENYWSRQPEFLFGLYYYMGRES